MKTLRLLAIFCLSAFAFASCGTPSDDNGGVSSPLLLVADKTTIYDNGEDAVTFSLYYEGATLTEGYEIYIDNATMLEGNTFTSTTLGTVKAQAMYGTVTSNVVSINVTVTPPPAPAAPEDKNPEKTNFKRRVLLTQITGTECQWCPLMINAVHQAMEGEYGDDAVLAIAHVWNTNDPAYLFDAENLGLSLGTGGGAPYLFMDLNKQYDTSYTKTAIDKNIENRLDEVAVRGGIAVNSEYHAEKNYIVLNATVKAKETAEFRIGAWLLEDGINARQTNPNSIAPVEGVDFNTHDNCIRLADSKKAMYDFTGLELGTIEAGKTASREFALLLRSNGTGNQKTWNHDNLHLVVFISTKEGDKWYVNNVVKCPKHGSVDFEYEAAAVPETPETPETPEA